MRDYMKDRLAKRQRYADDFMKCPTYAMQNSPAAIDARKRALPGYYAHIWLGVSVENAQAKTRINHLRDIGWVIVGGESGPGARPMHPEWVKDILAFCRVSDVPFFFKQWGEWLPFNQGAGYMESKIHETRIITSNGQAPDRNGWPVYRVGKKAAGRLLDDREWNGMPPEPRSDKSWYCHKCGVEVYSLGCPHCGKYEEDEA